MSILNISMNLSTHKIAHVENPWNVMRMNVLEFRVEPHVPCGDGVLGKEAGTYLLDPVREALGPRVGTGTGSRGEAGRSRGSSSAPRSSHTGLSPSLTPLWPSAVAALASGRNTHHHWEAWKMDAETDWFITLTIHLNNNTFHHKHCHVSYC